MFKSGDKAVFIGRGSDKASSGHKRRLQEGAVYYITDTWVSPTSGWLLCDVLGNQSAYLDDGRRVGFAQKWFRRVSEVQAENRATRPNKQPAGEV